MAIFEIGGLDHVVLRVRDLPRSIRFYCDVLGCRVERDREEHGLIQMSAGQSMIDLVSADGKLGREGGAPPGDEGRNMHHICLRIDPFDDAELSTYLEARGVTPFDRCMRTGADGYGPCLYVRDPDDNLIELKGPPEPAPR
jgi:glyoxylase I family protein